MTCETCLDLLSALLDRELSEAELQRVWAHLKDCLLCCRECACFCCVEAAAGPRENPSPPADLWKRIAAALPCGSGQFSTPAPEVLEPGEAADYLRLTLEELMEVVDEVPHFLIGSHLRFRRQAIEEWVQAQEQRTTTLPESRRRQVRPGVVVDLSVARQSRVGRM